MIRSFKDKDTERLWERNFVKQFAGIEWQARMRLERLDAAISLEDLYLPGMRLKKLAGNRAGLYSIRINDQYRVCFRWKPPHADDVEIVDYH